MLRWMSSKSFHLVWMVSTHLFFVIAVAERELRTCPWWKLFNNHWLSVFNYDSNSFLLHRWHKLNVLTERILWAVPLFWDIMYSIRRTARWEPNFCAVLEFLTPFLAGLLRCHEKVVTELTLLVLNWWLRMNDASRDHKTSNAGNEALLKKHHSLLLIFRRIPHSRRGTVSGKYGYWRWCIGRRHHLCAVLNASYHFLNRSTIHTK